jgi:hypothetical protein
LIISLFFGKQSSAKNVDFRNSTPTNSIKDEEILNDNRLVGFFIMMNKVSNIEKDGTLGRE